MSKKRTYREFRQGIYKPANKEKCLNKNPIVFRSFLEARLFRILDSNSNVTKWSSEETIIPYVHPIKTRENGKKTFARYFVDVFMEIKINNELQRFIVEIKPFKQTLPPSASNKKKPSTVIYESAMYCINKAKWEAAKAYAKKHSMEFLIITEKNIDFLEGK